MSEAGGSINDSESQPPFVSQLAQLFENEGIVEKLAALFGTARSDQEVDESLSLRNTVSGTFQEIKDDLIYIRKNSLRVNLHLQKH